MGIIIGLIYVKMVGFSAAAVRFNGVNKRTGMNVIVNGSDSWSSVTVCVGGIFVCLFCRCGVVVAAVASSVNAIHVATTAQCVDVIEGMVTTVYGRVAVEHWVTVTACSRVAAGQY